MSELLAKLKNNKGTTSSALGKALAKEVLAGDEALLQAAIDYLGYMAGEEEGKQVRAGAAKILEKVAEKKPALVAPHLSSLVVGLDQPEPQTRWMIIQVFGFCAQLNPEVAAQGLGFAQSYLAERQGVCLSGAADLYLGMMGAVSEKFAAKAFPLLMEAYENPLTNEMDWVLEGMMKIAPLLSDGDRGVLAECAQEQLGAFKTSTQKRGRKLQKILGKLSH